MKSTLLKIKVIIRFLFSWRNLRSRLGAVSLRFVEVAGGLQLLADLLAKVPINLSSTSYPDIVVWVERFHAFVANDMYVWALGSGVVVALIRFSPRLTVASRVLGTDIGIEISICEILHQDINFALTCSRSFDTKEPKFVKRGSLQSDFQHKFFQDVKTLDTEIRAQLKGILATKTKKRKLYPVGTVVKVMLLGRDYSAYMLAIPQSTESGGSLGAFVDYQTGIEKLWSFVKRSGALDNLAVPVFGTGCSGLADPGIHVIKEIVRSFVAESRNGCVAKRLRICIHPQDVARMRINMEDLQKYLDVECNKPSLLQVRRPKGVKELDD